MTNVCAYIAGTGRFAGNLRRTDLTIVDAKALVEARRKKRWTQVELSEATKNDVSTISRIERGKPTRVRVRTLKVLAKALDVAPENLCRTREVERSVMDLGITNWARNAFILVAVRYGITEENIVEVAPLLFFIAAEQCLQERRKRIAELRASADALIRLKSGIPHLPLNMSIQEDAASREEESITARDLFGNEVVGKVGLDGYEHAKQNPFVMFLRDNLAKASNSLALAESLEWDPKGWPDYNICIDEAAAIVGNDPGAMKAIWDGYVALHEMPEDKRSPKDIAAWVREEDERQGAKDRRLIEELKGRLQKSQEGTS
jgi:transcriptional regulator with XRE-family HTH domain